MEVKYLTEKGSGEINEDSFLITPNLFGIFDGATSLIKYKDAFGNTGGLIASRIAKEVFEKNSDKPLLFSFEKASLEIEEEMKKAGINMKDKAGLWSTSCSVVRINPESIEYLAIGDSPIVFVDKQNKLKTFFVDHDLNTYVVWEKLIKEGVTDIRKDPRTQIQLLKNRRGMNTDYGILDGEKEALKFIQTGSIPKENIKYILIFSDGMLIPKTDYKAPEDFGMIVRLFEEGGLEKVRSYVRELEKSDPGGHTYLRFKPYDDLTAIAISL